MKPTPLNYATYRDRVLAGWLGKSIGGAMGAPVENQKQRHQFTEETIWLARVPPNDDMDIQIVWLDALQERGLYLTSQDLAEVWQDRCWYNFCEYGVFLHNVQRGIAPPRSGTWNNDFFSSITRFPFTKFTNTQLTAQDPITIGKSEVNFSIAPTNSMCN